MHRLVIDNVSQWTQSNASQSSAYFSHQSGSAPILDGRYGNALTPLALPVELYNPVFASFKARLRDETIEPPDEIVALTAELMHSSSEISLEDERASPSRTLIGKLLACTYTEKWNVDRTVDFFVAKTNCNADPDQAAATSIIEETGEVGLGSDSSVRGGFSYIKFWCSPSRRV